MATGTAYILVCANLADADAHFASLDLESEHIDLWMMTTAFRRNFATVVGDVCKSAPGQGQFSSASCQYKIRRTRVYKLPDHERVPYRFNFYAVHEVTFTCQGDTPLSSTEIQADLLSILSPKLDYSTGELDVVRAAEAFGEDWVMPAVDRISGSSVECWIPDTENDAYGIDAQLFLFYVIAGYGLVFLEQSQLDIHLIGTDLGSDKTFAPRLLKSRLHITNINRLFLTRSQSPFALIRQRCEALIDQYRLRSRHDWLREIYDDISTTYELYLREKDSRGSRIISRILFALTAFTVLSGLFFGLFELNNESPIATEGPRALGDPIYLPPLLISLVALVILVALVTFWPQGNKRGRFK